MKEINNLTRCPKGHFYDGDKYETCPHCANTRLPGETITIVPPDDEITLVEPLPKAQPDRSARTVEPRPSGGKTETVFLQGHTMDQSTVTMQFYQKALGTEPVAGWLVCVRGVHYGQDFRIKAGRNFIGRGGNMDVCLSADRTVSRDRHAIVTYDPMGKTFLIQPGEGAALCYLNRKPVLVPTELHAGDRIVLGDTELIFAPFCGTLYEWNDEQQDS